MERISLRSLQDTSANDGSFYLKRAADVGYSVYRKWKDGKSNGCSAGGVQKSTIFECRHTGTIWLYVMIIIL